MKPGSVTIVAALSIVLLAAGCPEQKNATRRQKPAAKATPVSTTPSAAAVRTACEGYARTVCAKLQSCDRQEMLTLFGPRPRCEEKHARMCRLLRFAARTGYTLERLERCAKQVKRAACDAPLKLYAGACADPPGELADGRACVVDAQCASLNCTRASYSDARGACRPMPDEGEPCKSNCPAGMRCLDRCIVASGPSEPCASNGDCAADLVCSNGRCVRAAAEGQPCTTTLATKTSRGCRTGYYCKAKTCRTSRFLGERKPCTWSLFPIVGGAGPEICYGHLRCVTTKASKDDEGTCTAPLADGARCKRHGRPGCRVPARCVDGKCTVVKLER